MAVVLLSYVPAIQGGFIWDDDVYVQHNRSLRSTEGLSGIWLRPGEVPQYYPLVFTSFWIEYHLWGLTPLGYHLTNVLLHGLNAVLLWVALRQLALPGAWFAAALFALHPVHVESVAWITERKNVLSGTFYFAALLAYLRFRPLRIGTTAMTDYDGHSDSPAPPHPTPHSSRPTPLSPNPWPHAPRYFWYALSLTLFVCALMSKTVACSLPAVLLLLIWWKEGNICKSDLGALVPMFIVGLALGLQTVWIEKHYVGAEGKDWTLSWAERLLVMGRALWFYAGKLAWPQDLTFIYPRWQLDTTAWWQYLWPLGALALIVTLWSARERLGRGALVAVLIFVGTLAPALGLFDVYPMRYSFVADHFQYLASAGLLALAAGLMATVFIRFFSGREWLPIAAGTAALFALGFLTWQQASIYRDVKTLWLDTLAKNPDCRMAHNNLGSVFAMEGKLDEAVKHYTAAIRIDPNEPRAYYNLGELHAQMGDLNKAIEEFSTSIQLDPERAARPHRGLGLALARQDKLDEALDHLKEAVRLNPPDPYSHFSLALTLAQKNQLEDAIQEFQEAVRLSPGQAQLHIDLGIALGRAERWPEAAENFATAARLEPQNNDAKANLALTLARLHKPEEAMKQLTDQMRMDPNYSEAQFEVANALKRQGKIEEALSWYRHVVSLRPGEKRYLDSLNAALKQETGH